MEEITKRDWFWVFIILLVLNIIALINYDKTTGVLISISTLGLYVGGLLMNGKRD